MFIYHYHAQRQISPGAISHIDGIIETSHPIDSMDRYKEIKSSISKGESDPASMTICSLSLLGTK